MKNLNFKPVNSYYTEKDFESDIKRYIKAIKEHRMFCVIHSVSKSGMSRNLSFYEHTYKNGRGSILQFNGLFTALGYAKANEGFRVSGCGMDMVFDTNYNNIHDFKNRGFITKKTCDVLARRTPSVL